MSGSEVAGDTGVELDRTVWKLGTGCGSGSGEGKKCMAGEKECIGLGIFKRIELRDDCKLQKGVSYELRKMQRPAKCALLPRSRVLTAAHLSQSKGVQSTLRVPQSVNQWLIPRSCKIFRQ